MRGGTCTAPPVCFESVEGCPVVGKRFRWSRRRVVVAVVAAVAVVAVGASSASALTPFTPEWDERARALQYWTELANPGDFDVKDMKVAAPSSVITATGSESPTRRVQEVNNWRPNPQAWVDAKARGAATSGLTTADIESTSRWKPRVAKFVGVAGGLALGAEVAFTLADDVLYPALGLPSTAAEDVFCVRYGNWFTDTMGMVLRNLDCGEWRLANDYEVLVGEVIGGAVGTVAGVTYVGRGSLPLTGAKHHCYSVPPGGASLPPDYSFQVRRISDGGWFTVTMGPNGATVCGSENFAVVPRDYEPAVRVVRWGAEGGLEVVEAMVPTEVAEDAEWITRVRCLDGTSRIALSDAFQQERLGAVAVPAEVALDGCQPVGVDVGIQTAGTGTSGAGGGWSTEPGGTRMGLVESEVPVEVMDWMETYPQCMDGRVC